jgi:hypothetical protein
MQLAAQPTSRPADQWIRTYTGAKFWPLDASPVEVHIEDIAHSLSLVCRFTGHTHSHYSVADHSLRVSRLAEAMVLKQVRGRGRIETAREVALWGLLHDASEAYLCDLPSPLKHTSHFGKLYRGYERDLMAVIADRFALDGPEPPTVKEADGILLNTEFRDLMHVASAGSERRPETIHPLDAITAEMEFLRRFYALTSARTLSRLTKAANL